MRINTDLDSRNRFSDLQGQFFNGESQKKEWLKITIVNLPFRVTACAAMYTSEYVLVQHDAEPAGDNPDHVE